MPVVGFINTASSIFVNSAATGSQDGSQKKPFSTVNAALPYSTNGTIMRVAAGTYPESFSLRKANLVILGTGPKTTHIVADSGDALQVVLKTKIALRNVHIKEHEQSSK